MENGCFQVLDAAAHASALGIKEAQGPPAFWGGYPVWGGRESVVTVWIGTRRSVIQGHLLTRE